MSSKSTNGDIILTQAIMKYSEAQDYVDQLAETAVTKEDFFNLGLELATNLDNYLRDVERIDQSETSIMKAAIVLYLDTLDSVKESIEKSFLMYLHLLREEENTPKDA